MHYKCPVLVDESLVNKVVDAPLYARYGNIMLCLTSTDMQALLLKLIYQRLHGWFAAQLLIVNLY